MLVRKDMTKQSLCIHIPLSLSIERELNKRDSTIQALHDEIATWEGRHQSVCSQLREEQSIRNTLTVK